ncbi:uncharacterized protein [Littorina saxatilis]|uniref:uncharacterized protein n=1 Tax=Littorina saxatilis TaxID=31220 RepID=UPI0038B4275A
MRCKSYGQLDKGCVLKVSPDDSCCLVPECPLPPQLVTPKPLPGVTGSSLPNTSYIYTGASKGTFTGSGGVGTPTGTFGSSTGFTNGCVYNQTLYNQDATWQDGCDFNCVCLDALRGKYMCTDRCVSYYFLPPVCTMEQDPADTCCKRARCNPPTSSPPTTTPMQVSGQTATGPSGTGSTVSPVGTATSHTGTGPIINITPQTPPGYTGTKPSSGSVGGTVTSHTGTGPIINITPGIPTGLTGTGASVGFVSTLSSITGVRGSCVYKGLIYHTGDTWEDGCALRCTCNDDVKGLYTCTYRCPAYSGLPKYCHLQPDPSDACCKKPICTVEGTQLVPEIGGTPTRSPTLEPSITNVIPLGTHTIISGSSRHPGEGTQTMFGGRSSCVYKGGEYIPGETWDDGCDYTCTCEGNNVGLYRCASKCPSYPALPKYCTLSPIPGMCCASLSCDVPKVGGYNPYPQLEPNLKPTAGPNGLYPTPQPTLDPQLILGVGVGNITGGTGLPGGGTKIPAGYLHNLGGITDKCIYDLKMYNQGENWDVGCNYTCMCLDSRTGFYQCKEKCAKYDMSALPAICKLIADPADSCCQTPSCPDPKNPNQQITNITQIQQLYPVVGSFTGGTSGFRPGYVPEGNYGVIGGSRNGCVYKGSLHPAGSSWKDGCDFDCTCIDGATGMYQCIAQCPTYSLIPPMCKLEAVQGQCCPKMTCKAFTPASECRDKIDNCPQYRKSSCFGAYEGWAREHCPLFCEFCYDDKTTTPLPCEDTKSDCENFGRGVCTNVAYADWAQTNCRKFCNLCGTTTVATTIWTTPSSGCYDAVSYCEEYGSHVCTDPSYKAWVLDHCQKFCGICGAVTGGSTTPEPCEDLLNTCSLYGTGSCGGQYFGWARHNCRKFCGLCDVTAQTAGSTVSTTPARCVDKLTNCKSYSQQYCEGDYLTWAADNCPARCNLCNYQITTPTTVQAVTDPGWVVLMKGVSGVPGDLWRLWSTPNTANANVPQAQYLTNQYPGHYKPQVANEWSQCQFDKVKVAILSNGVEKANIIFDVRNSGKNDWFKPANVISSTFNDLPKAAENFIMGQDAETGHEFAVGQFADCQGTGWILISTNDDCPYQASGNGSHFYYSLTNTVAQLAPGKLGEGDVFAILGQGGNCMSGLRTTRAGFTGGPAGCFYKGKVYNAGDMWQDGCAYNCTCDDGATGQYFCIDQCPTYNNLPPECSLDKKPDQCCPELKCPYEIGEGCQYKNKTYPQGSTWQDGCEYDCTCQDGRNGHYTCTGICQDWSALPKTCHLEDPSPGMCCPRPVCPPGIVVQFNPR